MRASMPMFSSEPMESGLLAWLADESLYSLCSRMHVLHGHRLPAETARPPRHSGIEVIGDDYITPAGWSGELKFHAERIGECPSDEPLTIDAWDQS